jgi:hypothetical protein
MLPKINKSFDLNKPFSFHTPVENKEGSGSGEQTNFQVTTSNVNENTSKWSIDISNNNIKENSNVFDFSRLSKD